MSYISQITLPDGRIFDIKGKNIISGTTEWWSQHSSMISQEGFIYIYTDHQRLNGADIPGVKIGTTNAYVIDLPFVDDVYSAHIADTIIHITNEEREFWNNKVTAYVDPTKEDKLILSKD